MDRLPQNGLVSIGQTCNKFYRIAGDLYKHNYASSVYSKKENIYPLSTTSYKLNEFSAFIQNIMVYGGDLSVFAGKKFKALKSIHFYDGDLTSTGDLFYNLPKLESMKFYLAKFNGNIYETMFKYCTSLTHLFLKDNNEINGQRNPLIGSSDSWLEKPFPSLKRFEFVSHLQHPNIFKFLALNKKKLKHFSTNIEFLIANMGSIFSSGIQLNTLSILHEDTNIDAQTFETFKNDLWELKRQNFFVHLHLYYSHTARPYIYNEFSNDVKALHISNEQRTFNLYELKNLEELYIKDTAQITNFNSAFSQLGQLKYVSINTDNVDNISSLLRNLPALMEMQVFNFARGQHFNNMKNILDVSALDKERKNGGNYYKKILTIFVNEKIYSASKPQKLNYVEIKRLQSNTNSPDFCYS